MSKALTSFKTSQPHIGDKIDALFEGKIRPCHYLGLSLRPHHYRLEETTKEGSVVTEVYDGLASWRPVETGEAA